MGLLHNGQCDGGTEALHPGNTRCPREKDLGLAPQQVRAAAGRRVTVFCSVMSLKKQIQMRNEVSDQVTAVMAQAYSMERRLSGKKIKLLHSLLKKEKGRMLLEANKDRQFPS